MGMRSKNEIKKNILRSVSVQAISLLVSFALGFIVPKCIDEIEYANWQTFLLYISYAGVFHLGLLDGIVLRYSQYDFDTIDKKRLRSQFLLLLCFLSGIALMAILYAVVFMSGYIRTTVIFVALGIISKNLIGYDSYSFQITNRIKYYSELIIAQRVGYGIIVIFLTLLKVNNFAWYCFADIAGDVIGMMTARHHNKGMYLGDQLPFLEALVEWKENVSSGALLMFANFSSMLLIGGSKMVVQWRWDQLTFGKVSFAFSVSNLFLTFVNAISVVLFPQMKRMEDDELPRLYTSISRVLSPLTFIAMIAYFPGCWILEKFLPAYSVSLTYLGTLLPIIIYTSKVSLLINNYLKAYRKERIMLQINAASVAIAFALYFVSAYLMDSLNAVLISTVFVTMIRAIASEIVVMRTIKINCKGAFVSETVMTVAFLLCANLLNQWTACMVYAAIVVVYLMANKNDLMSIIRRKNP